jgi:negative regulator of flagellin synthesis FlgM
MKVTYIGKNDLKVSEKPEKATKPTRQTPQESAKTGEVRQDRIILSKDVQQLLEIEKSLKGTEVVEVRSELVERLRREIKEGVYSPDSRRVADKMIAEATKAIDED